jgi:hypothetical protein
MTQNIQFSVDADGIAHLKIDVAGRPMTVLTPGFQADLAECIEKVAADPAIKGAVILGMVLDELERRDLTTALVTLCVGGGMGTATIIERV